MFKRRKNGKPTGPWYFWNPLTGRRESTGTGDRELAKAIVAKTEREAVERKAGIYVPTFIEQTNTWLELNQSLAGFANQEDYAGFWKKHLKTEKLADLTPELVHSIVKRERSVNLKVPTKKNNTANNYVTFVAKIIRSGGLPCPKFHVYPRLKVSKAWLRPEEWPVLAQEMNDDLRDISTFLIATGLREKNVIAFEWTWIHGANAYLPMELTKTSAPYGIPLNKTALAVIERRRSAPVRHQKYVFVNNGRPWVACTLLERVKQAAGRAELSGIGVHTFRHTFASWLTQSGVPDAIRRRLGCWKQPSGADAAYLHFDVEWLRSFAEKLDTHLTFVPGEKQVFDSQSRRAS